MNNISNLIIKADEAFQATYYNDAYYQYKRILEHLEILSNVIDIDDVEVDEKNQKNLLKIKCYHKQYDCWKTMINDPANIRDGYVVPILIALMNLDLSTYVFNNYLDFILTCDSWSHTKCMIRHMMIIFFDEESFELHHHDGIKNIHRNIFTDEIIIKINKILESFSLPYHDYDIYYYMCTLLLRNIKYENISLDEQNIIRCIDDSCIDIRSIIIRYCFIIKYIQLCRYIPINNNMKKILSKYLLDSVSYNYLIEIYECTDMVKWNDIMDRYKDIKVPCETQDILYQCGRLLTEICNRTTMGCIK